MERILILGGKGLLGGALREVFADRAVTVWDRDEADITDESSLRGKIRELGPEAVINCAAWNDVDGAEKSPELANELNGTAVGRLAALCRQMEIPLVHYSTDFVFDGLNTAGYAEDAEPNPVNAYGASKAQGERLLRKGTEAYYLIRTSRLYGPPSESHGAKKNFVLRIIGEARATASLPVVDAEPGAFTYVKDLAEATAGLIDRNVPYGVYHLTPAGQATWYECAREIVSILGLPTKVEPVPRSSHPVRRVIPPYTVLRSTKVPHLREWREALRDFISTYRPEI